MFGRSRFLCGGGGRPYPRGGIHPPATDPQPDADADDRAYAAGRGAVAERYRRVGDCERPRLVHRCAHRRGGGQRAGIRRRQALHRRIHAGGDGAPVGGAALFRCHLRRDGCPLPTGVHRLLHLLGRRGGAADPRRSATAGHPAATLGGTGTAGIAAGGRCRAVL